MLQEPNQSDYDLKFQLLGFPIRIAWGFWLMAVILGWNWATSLHQAAGNNVDSPGAFVLLVVWTAGVFLSILIHELGHAFAFRLYGRDAKIVLYHFGGLAISDSFGSWGGARLRSIGPREQIVISAAGPVFQLGLAAVAIAIGFAMQIRMPDLDIFDYFLGTDLASRGNIGGSIIPAATLSAIIWPSIYWAILNLVPVFPLDGGQICQETLKLTNTPDPYRTSFMIGMIVGGLIALWFFSRGNPMGGMMFGLLAANNFQQMQMRGF